MISFEKIKELANKNQSRIENIIREYVQHLFLSSIYKQREAGDLLFKGGTALKIVYQSPRFSEDLDFSSINFLDKKKLENIFINSLAEISKENIEIELKEAKFTSGGYLGIISYNLYGLNGEIIFEVSLRKKKRIEKEAITIVSEYIPTYILLHLSAKQIIEEKIAALLDREKPRDYYDLYFILRNQGLNKLLQKDNLKKIRQSLLRQEINFKKELEILLPISHHQILKNFKNNLSSEIDKFL